MRRASHRGRPAAFVSILDTDFIRPFYDLSTIYGHFTAHFLAVSYTILHYRTNEKPRYSNLCGLYRGFYVGGVREI